MRCVFCPLHFAPKLALLSASRLVSPPVGYFVPQTTTTFNLLLESDDSSFMWLDTASTGGAASQPPNNGNTLATAFYGTDGESQPLKLNAGQGYPIRLQYGNLCQGGTNPGHLTLYCSINGGAWTSFTTGGPCGTLYYNPATTTSATYPGY